MPDPRRSIGALLLAALGGGSAWVSLGTMSVTDDRSMARLIALPPVWWAVAFVALAVAIAFAVRLPMARAWPLAIAALLWLPYLPIAIPPAFLVWSGPIEGLVWMAVTAGVLWGAPSPLWSRVQAFAAVPVRASLLGGTIVAACSCAAFVSLRSVLPAGDEPHYLVITQSLFRDGDLRIENNHKRGDYLAYFSGDLAKPDYIVRGTDDQIYSIHSPGISAVILPGFAVAGYAGAVATVILLTAAASALAWQTAWLLTASSSGAWFAWAAVFLTAPYFFHTFMIFPDGAGGLLAMIGIWLLAQFEARRTAGRLQLLVVGTALALLPWMHTRFAILAAGLGVVLTARLFAQPDRGSRIVAFAAVPVVSAIAWFGYFWMIWGTPNPAAPYGSDTSTAIGNIGRGLTGLLIDQQFGLIANAPVYALAIIGMGSLMRVRRRFAWELVVVAAPYALAASAFHMWWGGVSAPARFLAALMPLAAIPLASWWHRFPSHRPFGLALLLLSLCLVLPTVFVDHRLLHNDRDGFDLLLRWASANVDLPLAFPSLHRGTLTMALGAAVVWIAAGLLAMGASVISRTWTVTIGAAAVALMGATTITWALGVAPTTTVNRSQLGLLNAWRPPWQTAALRLRPFRALTSDEFARRIEVVSADDSGRPATDPIALDLSMLPAGEYEVNSRGTGAQSGELLASIGKTEQVAERWRVDGRQPGNAGMVLRLPVAVSAMTLRADPEARASITELSLRLTSLKASVDAAGRPARAAIRYGTTRVFFLDDRVYAEPSGFWTRGADTTTIVLDADPNAAPPVVWLQSGPIATSADLSVGTWSQHVTLAAQSRTSVTLPAAVVRESWVLTIQSGAAFRPIDHAPGNLDARPLGVWMELR